jgi:hypothetical protein
MRRTLHNFVFITHVNRGLIVKRGRRRPKDDDHIRTTVRQNSLPIVALVRYEIHLPKPFALKRPSTGFFSNP